MPRLYRPPIPVGVRIEVALRQLRVKHRGIELWMLRRDALVSPQGRDESKSAWLERLLDGLAKVLDCQRSDLRLDHHPALENRQWRPAIAVIRGKRREIMLYKPDANDPDSLMYRTRPDHDIKTRVRGDGAQFADNVIAKRERKRLKKLAKKANGTRRLTRRPAGAKRKAGGSRWGSRPWPKGRKMGNRPWTKNRYRTPSTLSSR